MLINNDTICAISTTSGQGAIAIIRISGPKSIKITNNIFQAYNKNKLTVKHVNKVMVGEIFEQDNLIDEVVVTLFKGPKSYTGEDIIEIACHGSTYIQTTIIQLLIKKGCRLAKNGEFTLRAFLNQKLDLSQAEGVAELIASENEKAHSLAMQQMKGGFSNEIKNLRDQFIKFASLIELELDFSQEDVEFVDRKTILKLIQKIKTKTSKLLESFQFGNAMKHGIPISIIGNPNSGKSTLLNTLLQEDRAIVSDIKGTTRDTIEEIINIQGYKFRFIDTAGLRKTNNKIEKIGIAKTYEKIQQSLFILYLIDKNDFISTSIEREIKEIQNKLNSQQTIMIIANKTDLYQKSIELKNLNNIKIINISAKNGNGVDQIINAILEKIKIWENMQDQIIIINQRHFESLINTLKSIKDVENGIKSNLSGELLALDIKQSLNYLGEITGEITNDNLLDSIFRDFCIGK